MRRKLACKHVHVRVSFRARGFPAPPLSVVLRYTEVYVSCDIHTHTPARKSYTNFMLY